MAQAIIPGTAQVNVDELAKLMRACKELRLTEITTDHRHASEFTFIGFTVQGSVPVKHLARLRKIFPVTG